MATLFIGLDVGSTTFHQVAMQPDGCVKLNRSFPMSEANFIKAFSGLGSRPLAKVILTERKSQ